MSDLPKQDSPTSQPPSHQSASTETTTTAHPVPEQAPTVQPTTAEHTLASTPVISVEPTTLAQPAPEAPAPAPAPTEMPSATGTVIAATPVLTPSSVSSVPAESEDTNKAEDVEPQNTLTQRFTEAEWKALKEFRASLSAILTEAFPGDETAKEKPVTMWGVKIDPANPKDAKISVVLMKFLRARNLSTTEAREMFVNTLRWRKSFNIEAALEEKFPEDIFGQLAHVYGHDKEGRPVVYNLYGANKDLKAVFGDVQRFIRWRVALMERSTELLDFNEIDQAIQIHDYEGVSLTSRDANSKAAAAEATNIFQSHYPELLYKKFFINVPTILNWIFWVFKPVISANTLAKMSVVGTGTHAINKALIPFIDAKELPERYGGEAKAF